MIRSMRQKDTNRIATLNSQYLLCVYVISLSYKTLNLTLLLYLPRYIREP